MISSNRRDFLKKMSLGTASTLLFPHLAENLNFEKAQFKTNTFNNSEEAFWESIKSEFKFENNIRYFNNASLGSSPLPVQTATNIYRATLDGFPSKYMWRDWYDDKEVVRQLVAEFFSVSNEEIAIIHNTTEGMNLIARSFDLKPGDEVIIANHEHSSGTIPWQVWQESKGVKLIRPELPMLPSTKDEVIEVYRKAITPRTKIISMCHIVNTNGMILPVKEVSEMAHELGIKVAVDGAQSAGMFTINFQDLGCDYYAASAHKWLFAPKGIGVFYARKDSQDDLKPLVVARGYEDTSIRRLENYNTRNLPEYLGLGESVKFLNGIGMPNIHKRSYNLKDYFLSKINLSDKFLVKTPASDDLSCAIQTLEIKGMNVNDVNKKLFEDYNIDTRPMSSFGLNGSRISFGIYITKKDIDYLVDALNAIAS